MNRKIFKAKQEKERMERIRRIEEFSPNSATPQKENSSTAELKAFDILIFLTRDHLGEIFKEYGSVGVKHNARTNVRWMFGCCRDLKTETSRLDELKNGFFNIGNDAAKMEETITRLTNKNKSLSSTHEKEVNTGTENIDPIGTENIDPIGTENIDPIPPEALQKIIDHHNFTLESFLENNKYIMVGFNRYRCDQCPNVKPERSIIETGIAPNMTLQETMLSLKITKEEMITQDTKEKKFRILSFGIDQMREEFNLSINIPEIEKYDRRKIILRSSDTGVYFYADNHKGKNYVFEISNFAHKINRKFVRIDSVVEDSVTICVAKQKREFWKEFFYFRTLDKELWEREMRTVLKTMNEEARKQVDQLDFAWNIALILVNCRADLLNLPHDLNHVNKSFESYEEMVYYYRTTIPLNPNLKALFYILGGAVYKMIMKPTSSFNSKNPSNKNVTSKYEEMAQEITETSIKHAKSYEEAHSLYLKGNYEDANALFEKALSFCVIPRTIVVRGCCLLKLGRFKEAFMDSIFALRNLDTYRGFPALLTLLEFKIRSGEVISAIDMAISLEYKYKQRDKNLVQPLKTMRRNGLCILNNIFKSFSFIFKRKYRDAIPFLEKAERIIHIKSGHSSVILLLLHFIYKNYEEAIILGKKILDHGKIYRDLVYYLLGMSSFYVKKLSNAINYLENLRQSCLGEITKIEDLRNLIRKADYLVISEKLVKDLMRGGYLVADVVVDYYNRALQLAKDNDQLSAHIFTKLGVVNFFKRNYKEAVRYLTYSIDLAGSSKNILLVRAESYLRSGKVNEAEEDYKEAMKYKKQAEALKDMELKKIRKLSI